MTAGEIDPGEVQPFRVVAFFTADHAELVNGKVYINGGFWTRLQFPMYPAVVPPIAIVAALHVPFRMYQAEHAFGITLEDADGGDVGGFRVEGQFRIGADPSMDYGEPTTMPIVSAFAGLVLPHPGAYSFVLRVDGVEMGRHKIQALQIALPQQFFAPRPSPPPAEDG